jgi:O-antigen/teichoic acid export membrane protein
MSQLKKGALLSYINIGITNITGLILTPYIIRSLGDSEYGLYILVGSMIAYISLLDLGLNNTIIRYVSKYRAEKDKIGEENFLATTMLIYAFISIITVAIGISLYFNLDSFFKDSLTTEEMVKAKKMFLVLIFNLAITLPGGSFTATCNAYEHFVFPRVLLIIKYLSRAALIFTLLLYFPYALTLVWIDTILNLIIIGISAFYVFKTLKVRFKLHQWNTKLVKDIFSYSVWIFLAAIVMRLQWNAGQLVLGISEDTVAVAIFGVGVLLGGYYGAFAGAINTLLLPKATSMSVYQNKAIHYNSIVQKVGRLNGFVLFLILAGFFTYGKDFIILWVGDTYLYSWEIALLIMIAMTLHLLQAFGNSILQAKKKNRFKSLIGLVTVSIAVISAIFLVPLYHFRGVIYPLFIALILNSFFMSWYYYKIFGFDLVDFLKNVVIKPVLVVIPIGILFFFIKNYWQVQNWLDLSIQVFLFVAVYSILIFFFVMNTKERKMIWSRK